MLRGPFEGTPVARADFEANATGDCTPARRLIRSDGTVLQLYPVYSSEPIASLTQTMRVYTPEGMRYEVEMRNLDRSGFIGTRTRKYTRSGPGRENLPLDERRTRRTHLGPSVGTYGWPGFYGTAWYNDPAEDLTTIFVMQRAHAGDQALPMWLDLWTAVYQAIDD